MAKVVAKCHHCRTPLPEQHYDVVLYAEVRGSTNLVEEVPVCVPCLKLHHKNKATRMEKV